MASTFEKLSATRTAWTTHDPSANTSVVIQNLSADAVLLVTAAAVPATLDVAGIELLGGADRAIEFDPGELIHVRSLGHHGAQVVIAY